MKLRSVLSAGVFAVVLQVFTFGSASATPLTIVDASVTDVGITITEFPSLGGGIETPLLGGGSYTVTNNSSGGLTGFGVSNPQSLAFVGSLGFTTGSQNGYTYESLTLNATNWLIKTAFIDGSLGAVTFQNTFGDFTNNVQSGENTINWYSAIDGELLPGQNSSNFFLFSDGLLASIGLGIIGNGQTIFNNLTINAPSVVPLPAALPLYGTGLAIMGFIGWRRKRKIAA